MVPRRRNRDEGFTLIELLIVVAIIGIIAAIAIVALGTALEKGRQKATMADIRTVATAIELYRVDNGFLPDSTGGLPPLVAVLIPYQTSVVPINDRWNHVMAYTSDAGGSFSVESYGKDGVDGTNITIATRFNFDEDIIFSNGIFSASPE
jgi:general secretion pathway protein G